MSVMEIWLLTLLIAISLGIIIPVVVYFSVKLRIIARHRAKQFLKHMNERDHYGQA